MQVEMPIKNSDSNNNYFPRIQQQPSQHIENMGFQMNNHQRNQLQYHQMMQNIEQMKTEFLNDHFNVIKEEGVMLKEQGMLFEKISRSPKFDAKSYMENIQRNISRKIEILTNLQNKAQYLSDRVHQSEQMGMYFGEANHMSD